MYSGSNRANMRTWDKQGVKCANWRYKDLDENFVQALGAKCAI